MTRKRLRVLWIHHAAVVTAWRTGRTEALADEGVDVTVAVPPVWNEGGAAVDLEPEPGEDVRRLPTIGSHPLLFLYDPRALGRLLREERFDLIDVHEEPASLALAEVLSLLSAAGVDTPTVAYSAQNLLKRYPTPFRQLEQRALARVRAVHTCNDDVERVLRAKGFTGEVVNLGLGVDLGHFRRTGADPDEHSRRFRVGFVGRFTEQKGVFPLVAAIGALPDVEAVFVGAGPEEARLRAAVRVRGLDGRVQVTGFADHALLPEVYRDLDVLVAPSLDRPNVREQFGRVLVEAMACGTPVIASDVGALPDVAGGAALIVPYGDVSALSHAIGSLRDDPELRRDLIDRGLGRASDFSWARIAADQAALYRRVLQDG